MKPKLSKGLAVRQTIGGRQCDDLSHKFWLCLDFQIGLVLLRFGIGDTPSSRSGTGVQLLYR